MQFTSITTHNPHKPTKRAAFSITKGRPQGHHIHDMNDACQIIIVGAHNTTSAHLGPPHLLDKPGIHCTDRDTHIRAYKDKCGANPRRCNPASIPQHHLNAAYRADHHTIVSTQQHMSKQHPSQRSTLSHWCCNTQQTAFFAAAAVCSHTATRITRIEALVLGVVLAAQELGYKCFQYSMHARKRVGDT